VAVAQFRQLGEQVKAGKIYFHLIEIKTNDHNNFQTIGEIKPVLK